MMTERVHQLLDTAASRNGSSLAVACEIDGACSYAELRDGSTRLAELLRREGVTEGARAMLIMARRFQTISAMFAASRAGCAWVSCHPRDPMQRLRTLIGMCRPAVIIADDTNVGRVADVISQSSAKPMVVVLGDAGPEIVHRATAASAASAPGGRVAQIIFTSGSTAAPRGVMVSHGAILDYVRWAADYFAIVPSDRVGSTAPFNFDMSTFDIFAAIAAGASIHIVPDEEAMFPAAVVRRMRDSRITIWKGVASLVAMIARSGALTPAGLPDLRILAFAGEAMDAAHLRTWMEQAPHVRFFNAYGPTEATGVSVIHEVRTPPAAGDQNTPIGRPRSGIDAFVLDNALQAVPAGEVGELLLAGASLSEGYWENEQETSRRFISPPASLASVHGRRIYRTGDLVRQDDEGNLWFLGRTDDEIKVSGYRMSSLAIIEALRSSPGVSDAVVLSLEDPIARAPALIGFVRVEGEGGTDSILASLRLRLPAYMCPRKLIRVPEIPLNDRGKVDRKALAEIFAAGSPART